MAEAKKQTPQKTSASKVSKETGDFQEIFSSIRNSFMDTMKKLSSYQKDFEKIISEYREKGVKYQQDITKVMEQWYSGLTKMQEELNSLAKQTLNAYMPSNYNLPFAVEYEKLTSQMQDMFKKFFSAFPVFK